MHGNAVAQIFLENKTVGQYPVSVSAILIAGEVP